jgi:flagellar FliL protein
MSPAWAEEEVQTGPKTVYYDITEPFTINFLTQSNQEVRFMQLRVSLMAYDQETITASEENLPMIQDALRTLFSSQTMETVNTVEGRKDLQKQALEAAQQVLEEETGSGNLKGVYFTSFVLQ